MTVTGAHPAGPAGARPGLAPPTLRGREPAVVRLDDAAADGRARRGSYHSPSMAAAPQTIDDVAAGLRSVGYLPGESTALVSFLAAKLGKPILVEGPAGVGKTELARALSNYLGRRLVRLQCYEGLDEAKALYEWNYRKQLLRIQAEAEGAGWQQVQDDIFGE